MSLHQDIDYVRDLLELLRAFPEVKKLKTLDFEIELDRQNLSREISFNVEDDPKELEEKKILDEEKTLFWSS